MAHIGERRFRTAQLMKWIHQFGITDFNAMTNLSKSFRARLTEETEIRFPEIVAEQRSHDGTIKWSIKVDSKNCIETVFIPDADRGTLCISSQVGCPLDCAFCATAKQGFGRNLAVAEIIGQLWLAARRLEQTPKTGRRITNIVMMGMGEPLLNLDNVVGAIDVMMDDHAYNLARKRITVSTAGYIPGMDKLRRRAPVSLAVSLHAPNNALRDELVPLNKTYPVEALVDACRRWAQGHPLDQITFEYVMLRGVNDSPALAKDCVRLLQGIPAKVNLIPFNPVTGIAFECSSRDSIDRFRECLVRAGIVTITRKTRGGDIDAACGQLVGKVMARSVRHHKETSMEKQL